MSTLELTALATPSLPRVTIKPLTAPNTAPAVTPAATGTNAACCPGCANVAAITPVSATTDPSERSTPPVSNT